MSLMISAFELGLVAWSHQGSDCERVLPFRINARTGRHPVNHLRADGVSSLYGVTPAGDELDLVIQWRAIGEYSLNFDNFCVFSRPEPEWTRPDVLSFKQSIVLVDNNRQPMHDRAREHAILNSIHCCDWQLPARQCLPRRGAASPSLLRVPRSAGCSAVST